MKIHKNDPLRFGVGSFFLCILLTSFYGFTLPDIHKYGILLQQDSMLKPIVVFEEETHDFGVLKEGTIASYDFLFTNQGKSPLIILGVSSPCGCTTPYYSKDPIPPGKTGVITITFNSTNRAGTFSKAIRVKTNASNPENILIIRGLVEPKSLRTPSPVMNN